MVHAWVIACLLMVQFPLHAWAADTAAPGKRPMRQSKVLVLNSYHVGYIWSDKILDGIRSVLEQETMPPEVYVEYLDTKRNAVSSAFMTMHDLLKDKYANVQFDVVIVSDDNALSFAHAYRGELFPGVPVVFCGVNDFRPQRVRAPWLTGVIEKQDMFGTVDLALKLDPKRNSFFIISDETSTGVAMAEGMREAMPLFGGRAEFHELVGLAEADMRHALSTLPDNAVVVYLSYYRTGDGHILTAHESMDLVLKASTAPTYTLASHYLPTAVMGGVMLSGKKQGEVAGNMARRILAGESVAGLPMVTDSPNIVTLNYKVMQRFGYTMDHVPENVIVSGKPYSLWEEQRTLLLTVVGLGILQTIVIVLLVVNVRRREQAEQGLKDARDLVLDIINSMPSVLAHTDGEGRILSMNKAAVVKSGVSPGEANGSVFTTVFPFLQRHEEMILEAIRRRVPLRQQRVSVVLDGTPAYFDIETFPLTEATGGGSAGVMLRVDDVSDRVQMETMIVQTEKMLSLGGLAAGMAHEINNPLGGILQGAQNIERRIALDLPANIEVAARVGCRLEDVRNYLEERGILRLLRGIRESGVRAAEIVSHLLDFSRGEASRRTLVDMGKLVESVLELARSDYDLKSHYDFAQIVTSVDVAQGMPRVPCSSSEMEQVLLNLVKNAAQAIFSMDRPLAEGRLDIRVYHKDERMYLEVQDNGPGLDAVTRTRVFEPFFTTRGPSLGVGLGLSVAYFIITRNHNGTFVVESEPDKGACFIISLPLEDRV